MVYLEQCNQLFLKLYQGPAVTILCSFRDSLQNMVQRFSVLKALPIINLLQRSLNIHKKFYLFLHSLKLVSVNKNGNAFPVLSDYKRSFSILNLLYKVRYTSSNLR